MLHFLPMYKSVLLKLKVQLVVLLSCKHVVKRSLKPSTTCFTCVLKCCVLQTWYDNMSRAGEAKIKPFSSDDYTCISFQPDLSKFKMESLDRDTVALLTRRAYDIAGSTKGVKVFLNGAKLPVSAPRLSYLLQSFSKQLQPVS